MVSREGRVALGIRIFLLFQPLSRISRYSMSGKATHPTSNDSHKVYSSSESKLIFIDVSKQCDFLLQEVLSIRAAINHRLRHRH